MSQALHVKRNRTVLVGYQLPACIALDYLVDQVEILVVVTETLEWEYRNSQTYEVRRRIDAWGDLAVKAEELGLPIMRLAPSNLETILLNWKPDLLVCVGYHHRLTPSSCAAQPAVNLHAGLLPQYRGRFPIQRALYDKAPVIGVTAHYMVWEYDAGNILATATVPTYADDSFLSAFQRTLPLYKRVLADALPRILRGDLGEPQ